MTVLNLISKDDFMNLQLFYTMYVRNLCIKVMFCYNIRAKRIKACVGGVLQRQDWNILCYCYKYRKPRSVFTCIVS